MNRNDIKARWLCHDFLTSVTSETEHIKPIGKSFDRMVFDSGVKCFKCNESILMDKVTQTWLPCGCK